MKLVKRTWLCSKRSCYGYRRATAALRQRRCATVGLPTFAPDIPSALEEVLQVVPFGRAVVAAYKEEFVEPVRNEKQLRLLKAEIRAKLRPFRHDAKVSEALEAWDPQPSTKK